MNQKTRGFWDSPSLSADARRRWEREQFDAREFKNLQLAVDSLHQKVEPDEEQGQHDAKRAEAALMYTEFKLREEHMCCVCMTSNFVSNTSTATLHRPRRGWPREKRS